MKRTRVLAALIGMSAALWAAAANANLILNGNFETGTFSSWTVSGNVNIASGPFPYFGAGSNAQDGTAMAAFNAGNSTPNGSISQSFTTFAGQTYLVQFDYGVTNGGPQTLKATVTGAGPTLATFNASDVTPPAALASFSFQFTADSALTTLKFADVSTNNTVSLDGVLDNIVVTQTPEPGGLALLGLGLAGLGVLRRRRLGQELTQSFR